MTCRCHINKPKVVDAYANEVKVVIGGRVINVHVHEGDKRDTTVQLRDGQLYVQSRKADPKR